ncbi:MAG: DegT/DnrJ/EryC1/StrS aminotransferase family protein [Acidobacteriota bacterium]
MSVPFFRPDLPDAEIDEVVATLRSGWLTTGPRTKRFEVEFAAAVGAEHALAVNSCTAAMHLALAVLGLGKGQAVLVPTMTFAATAEVVRYFDAVPILVDCHADTLHIDLADAEHKLEALATGRLGEPFKGLEPVGIMPVHVAGLMMDMQAVRAFADRHGLWIVEDAAHAFPAAQRLDDGSWRRCGENTAEVTCYSFYANKTITTGEGGMAVTADADRDAEMRSLSLHGLSNDAWGRYTVKGSWDYRILAPGYKYNLTDIASAIGLHQLARADALRDARAARAQRYLDAFAPLAADGRVELPPDPDGFRHAWHLFYLRIAEDLDRDELLATLRARGIGTSVHWRPLHLHPYYGDSYGWTPEQLPVTTREWRRLVSLPLFPTLSEEEQTTVIDAVTELCRAV